VDYITRFQEASLPAAMAERAIKGAPQHKGEEGKPPGNDHINGGIATFDQKGEAPQKPQETIAAYATRVQMAVATTSGEAIAYTGNVKQDSNTPQWNNRASAKCITAQAVFEKRAVERPWTHNELTTIAARNDEYGREQQQAVRYECRHIMTTVVTCKIVKNGLSNPLMRKVATKIAEECTSTDGFKAKLTQIKDFNQPAKPKKNKTPGISQEAHATTTQYAIEKATRRGIKEGRELQKTENAIEQATQRGIEEQRERQKQRIRLTCQGCKQRGRSHVGHTDKQCWYTTQTHNDNTPSCAWCEHHRAQSAHKDHTIKNCFKRADQNAKRNGHQREIHKEIHRELNTIQMKKDKTKDFANGEW
jgi:hypothetical protein